MDPLLQKLLDRIKSTSPSAGGVRMASDYLGMVISCAEEAACNLELHRDATAEQWLAAVKAAQKTLTHSGSGSVVLGGKGVTLSFGDDDHLKELTPGAVMDYVTVMTSINEDRDEDILHPKGANIPDAMPLLYHHNPVWPIGKMVSVVSRNDSVIKLKNSIADVPLGNEAAYLVEFGALNTSHGFRPKKLRERKSAGYEILEYDVFEVSLVPEQSNLDAVVTAHSRGKLKSAVNVSWANEIKKSMPRTVVGGFTKSAGDCDGACKHKNAAPVVRFAPKEATNASGKKELGIPARMGYDGQLWVGVCLEKSWEWVGDELEEDAKGFLVASGVKMPDYCSVCVLGTFDDSCVVAVIGGGESAAFYRCDWSMVADEPTLSGTPVEVELAVQVMPDDDQKSADPGAAKKSAALKSAILDRVSTKMSKMQLAKLKRAKDLMHAVRTADELKPATKASADSAHSLMMILLRDKKSADTKLAKMTIAKLKQVKELASAVHASPELKEPTRAAARSARDVVASIIAGAKSASADETAAELCGLIRDGEELNPGSVAAVREELGVLEESLLAKELTATN